MQNAFNNMLLVGAKLYIQRTDVGDKFFTAIINSAATITGTGTDQVFAYDVTDVSTIGQVFQREHESQRWCILQRQPEDA